MWRTIINFFRRKPTLTPVYIKDGKSGGFTVYFKEYPAVVSQGKTQEEALINLHEDFVASLEIQKRYSEQNVSRTKKQLASQ